ncbi:MAG: hypothetical protein ABSB50_19195 [Terracidiphilus sp.]|jgi:hypothetical protein
MEIAPIPGIRALPAVRVSRSDAWPPAIFDIDPSAKPGDGREQRSGRKASGAEESEEGDLVLEGETAADSEVVEESPLKQVDYFA